MRTPTAEPTAVYDRSWCMVMVARGGLAARWVFGAAGHDRLACLVNDDEDSDKVSD